MTQTSELVARWRDIGPVEWSQGPYGWIGEDGLPITLTPWQRAALAAWFDHRDTVTTLALSNIKKSGKTLLNAVFTAWRWLALPGVHFAVGNDMDQATARQFAEIADMCKRHPYLSTVVKIERRRLVFTPTGSVLEALATDAAGNAGSNHLTASSTEAWGVLYEAGIRAFEELTPPPGRFWGLPALRVVDSYAGFEGESETWHAIVDRGLAGERLPGEWPLYLAGGLLLFHGEGEQAQRQCFRGTPQEAKAYYADQKASLRENAFIRLHLNQRTSSEGAFITREMWDECYSKDVHPLASGDRRSIAFGLDASTSNDTTSLVGTLPNDIGGIDVVYVKVWKPGRSLFRAKPTVDLSEVSDEVLKLHRLGVVGVVCFDPFQLHSIGLELAKVGVRMQEMPQTSQRIEADTALYQAIQNKKLRHFGDAVLTEHVINAGADETPRGMRIVKTAQSRKIDACIALSMSHYAALGQAARGGMTVMGDPWTFADMDPADRPVSVRAGDSFIWCKPGTGTHRAGVDHTNCTKGSGDYGCQACVEELDRIGYYADQDALRKPGEERWVNEEFNAELKSRWVRKSSVITPEFIDGLPTPTEEEVHAEVTKKLFWGRLNGQNILDEWKGG